MSYFSKKKIILYDIDVLNSAIHTCEGVLYLICFFCFKKVKKYSNTHFSCVQQNLVDEEDEPQDIGEE